MLWHANGENRPKLFKVTCPFKVWQLARCGKSSSLSSAAQLLLDTGMKSSVSVSKRLSLHCVCLQWPSEATSAYEKNENDGKDENLSPSCCTVSLVHLQTNLCEMYSEMSPDAIRPLTTLSPPPPPSPELSDWDNRPPETANGRLSTNSAKTPFSQSSLRRLSREKERTRRDCKFNKVNFNTLILNWRTCCILLYVSLLYYYLNI